MNLQVYSELVFNLFKNAWDQGRSLNFLTTSEKSQNESGSDISLISIS